MKNNLRNLIAGLILFSLWIVLLGYSSPAFASVDDAPLALATATATASQTRIPTKTATPSQTRVPTQTPSRTQTRWPTNTPSATQTRWPTQTYTPGRTPTASKTFTPGPITPSATFTAIRTVTPTFTRTPGITATPSSTATSGSIVTSPNFQQVFMFTESNGWAITDQYVIRTTNGGAAWYNVSMPGAIGFGLGTPAYFRDANSGWVLIGGESGLYHTANGGASWSSAPAPFGNALMQFVDDNNGFALVEIASGMGKESIAFYQTTDGGATWTLNFTNEPGMPGAGTDIPLSGRKEGLTFIDAARGWISGNSSSAGFVYLYKTTDGGLTWAQQALTLPAGYASAIVIIKAPTFFNANDGLLPVSLINGGTNTLFIYATHDSGSTWTASLNSAPNGYGMLTDCFSMSDCITWASDVFAVTHDTGNNWTTVTPNVAFDGDFAAMDFVSKTTGWVLTRDADNNSRLYKTSDGGTSWTPGPILTPTNTNIGTATRTPTRTLTPAATRWPTRTPTKTQTRWPTKTRTPTRTPISTRTSTPTPTATAYMGPFAVMDVASNDVLNIRSGAGVSYPIVATFAYNEKNVMRAGLSSTVDGSLWVQVYRPDSSVGWVNSFYLTEYTTPEFFVADWHVNAMIERLKQAMVNSDGELFASLVSPKHGAEVVLHHYGDRSKIYFPDEARNAFASAEQINWGSGARGMDDIGTFAAIIQPKLLDVFNYSGYELHANDPQGARTYSQPWPARFETLNFYSLWKPGTPGIELDWREWLIGIEYVNGQPYVITLIHFEWEP
jgi:photosystem II stability/assembly factor-like uncharacterized protein